jgi:hypothetical protein
MKCPAADPVRPPPDRIDRGISLGDASFPRSGSLEFPPARRRSGSQRLSGALDAELFGSVSAMDYLTTSYSPNSKRPGDQFLIYLRNDPFTNIIALIQARQIVFEQLHNANSELFGVIDKIHPLKDEFRSLSKQIRENHYLGAEKWRRLYATDHIPESLLGILSCGRIAPQSEH